MPLIDCQQDTAHLARLGARPISRQAFADASRAVGTLDGTDRYLGILTPPARLP